MPRQYKRYRTVGLSSALTRAFADVECVCGLIRYLRIEPLRQSWIPYSQRSSPVIRFVGRYLYRLLGATLLADLIEPYADRVLTSHCMERLSGDGLFKLVLDQ